MVGLDLRDINTFKSLEAACRGVCEAIRNEEAELVWRGQRVWDIGADGPFWWAKHLWNFTEHGFQLYGMYGSNRLFVVLESYDYHNTKERAGYLYRMAEVFI